MSDRDAFRANRDAFKAKHHEQRLENATYTAAEVKVLTEAALRLGRKEAADEIAAAIEARRDEHTWSPDRSGGLTTAAGIARDISKGDPA